MAVHDFEGREQALAAFGGWRRRSAAEALDGGDQVGVFGGQQPFEARLHL